MLLTNKPHEQLLLLL